MNNTTDLYSYSSLCVCVCMCVFLCEQYITSFFFLHNSQIDCSTVYAFAPCSLIIENFAFRAHLHYQIVRLSVKRASQFVFCQGIKRAINYIKP